MDTKKLRIGIGIFLGLVIVGFSIFVFANRGNLFYSTVRVSFPDGCIEQYKGDVLVSPECTTGRQIMEAKANKTVPGRINPNNLIIIPANLTTLETNRSDEIIVNIDEITDMNETLIQNNTEILNVSEELIVNLTVNESEIVNTNLTVNSTSLNTTVNTSI